MRALLSPARRLDAAIAARRRLTAMATAYKMVVPAQDTGLLRVAQDAAAAATVSELLQRDLESHHIFFNDDGFHNHLAHQLLTLYGTGAPAAALERAWDANRAYQRPLGAASDAVVAELEADFAAAAPRYLGRAAHYADFLRFFQRAVAARGWQDALAAHLLADAPPARDLLGRLFAGFLHPAIHLLYGVEWAQPALVAAALAQAAVHDARLGVFLAKVDAAAAAADAPPPDARPVAALCEAVGAEHPALAASARWTDPNRIHDGVLARAEPEAVALLARIRVAPDDDLDERAAEMAHGAAYIAAAASWKPPYMPKFDFFLIHHLTSAPLFLALNRLAWVPAAAKARLLAYKMRLDVVEYLARGCPPLRRDALRTYAPPGEALVAHPRDLLPRFHAVVDDGHAIKAARALLLAQDASRPWAGRPWVRIDSDDMWLRAMYLLLRSVEHQDFLWVRAAGFDEAWRESWDSRQSTGARPSET